MESTATKLSEETTKIFSVSRPKDEYRRMLLAAEFVYKMQDGRKGLSEFVGFLFDFWSKATLGSIQNVHTNKKLVGDRDPDEGSGQGPT